MTNDGLIHRIGQKLGGMRNLLFTLTVLALGLVMLLDLRQPEHILTISAYFYLFFGVLFAFYALYPLYSNRRLTLYYWERTKRHRLAMFGLAFIVFLMVLAVIGPSLTTDPTAANFSEQNTPPVGFSYSQSVYDISTDKFTTRVTPGTWSHPLGTDDKGRDMLAMLVSGTRISFTVGVMATLIAIFIGTIMGVASAYFGGWIDNIFMRFTDVMMTFPFFLLLVFIVFIYGPSIMLIILAIGLTGWTGTARLVRSEALSLRTREYIMAAKTLGVSDAKIIFRHLIPNVVSIIIVISALSIPGNMLAETGLSFIGLGDPSVTSWGEILYTGQRSLVTAWWIAVEPGILLFLTFLAFNFLGDGLRDALDPKSMN